MSVIKVKPLVWTPRYVEPDTYQTWDAYPFDNLFIRYTLKQLGTGGAFAIVSPFSIEGSRHLSLAAAQAAAQLEWDSFVLSAIVSQDTRVAAQQDPKRTQYWENRPDLGTGGVYQQAERGPSRYDA